MFGQSGFDPLDDLAQAIDKIAAHEGALDPVQLARLGEQLECQRLRALRRFERDGEWRLDGSVSLAAWLRARTRTTAGIAADDVRLARALEQLPAATSAWGAGEITRQHVRVMADACTRPRAHTMVAIEDDLVAVARDQDARSFRNIVRHFTDALDGNGGAAAADRQHARRSFHLSETLDGMWRLDGLLDPELGGKLDRLVRARVDPPTMQDLRTAGQRRADALADIIDAAAAQLERGAGAGASGDVMVAVDLWMLERRAGTGLAEIVRAEAARRLGLSSETLRRITCDGRIARVITDGRSEVLDVGRTTRVVPPGMRRGLDARDGGCVHRTRAAIVRPSGATPTTRSTGRTEERRVSTTWNCGAGATTAPCTKARGAGTTPEVFWP
jgi:hypothetical protein